MALGPGVQATWVTRGARVLVVDDDVFMREILARLFRTADIAVETFSSGVDLLHSTALATPAVLLLDIQMPAMSGLELQRELTDRGVTFPVIFLTGISNVPLAVTAMRNGAVDFLEKPFDPEELTRRVRHSYQRFIGPVSDDLAAAPAHQQRFASLTPRERDVLSLMLTGQTSKMMARKLGGSHRTIEIHRGRVMNKMAASSLADLIRMSMDAQNSRL